jgi:polysaccharide biosynthesis protein PslH
VNILFLAHRIPYPPDKGDKIRSFHELRHLSRGHRVFLGTTLDRPSDREYLEPLRTHCAEAEAASFNRRARLARNCLSRRAFSVDSFYDPGLQHWVDCLLARERIDAVFCFCSVMAEYVFRTPGFRLNGMPRTRKIMDYVDLDSDKWRQYAEYRRFPLNLLYRIEKRRLFSYEMRINRAFDHSVFVAERERKIFEAQYPSAKAITVVPNGVDYTFFSPREENIRPGPPTLVFTGVMDYFANEDGVRWFCSEILPRIRQQVPHVEFCIVGNRPTPAVRKLGRLPGVTVTGYVEDVRDYYSRADVCVIPLRIARGLQNKPPAGRSSPPPTPPTASSAGTGRTW